MPRDRYRSALDDLRDAVVGLGEDVVVQLETGLAALESGDPELARAVIDGDDAINEAYLAVESDCIDLFALQQPVAGDLRFVAASFKILTDLERIGDLATNLGRYALAESSESSPEVDVVAIGREARDAVEDALTAYRTRDVELCREIHARDDRIDALCQRASERVVRDLVERETGNDAWAVERLLDDVSRLLLTVRDVERVADHAVNVAARTLYVVEHDSELLY
ncbi:phosphate signaling complex protein PhoU [Halorubrum rubrum]|uniref:Phosphate-specific transport system accessory protein PhoU n=1 Tax=Halorubrum rubrum TaxID=1126240 RepID=A0ABD5QXF0_9EURY|nr:phosphate signaling complex protein PhoU [Halorubrum rubrum]